MTLASKVIAPLALAAGIAWCTVLVGDAGAQPPFGKGRQPGKEDKKKADDKKGEKKDRQPGDRKGPPSKSDAVVDAWVKVLIEKITDPHDTVRESARGALVGVGPAALPALQRLADGDDPAKAVAARKLIGEIQRRGPDRGARGDADRGRGPDFGGFGREGMGPMGPGMGRGFGFPGMGPGGWGGWGKGGDRERGPKRPGRDDNEVQVAPMPRAAGH